MLYFAPMRPLPRMSLLHFLPHGAVAVVLAMSAGCGSSTHTSGESRDGSPDCAVPHTDAATRPDVSHTDAAMRPDVSHTDATSPQDAWRQDSTSTDTGGRRPVDAATDAGHPTPPTCDSGAAVTVRIVTGNLSSGNDQSYTTGEGGRIFKALDGDVVMIQEFNVNTNSDADVQAFVTRYFGPTYIYDRGTGQIPNGVITRWPILASGTWTDQSVSNRNFVWAKIDIPGPTDLYAVSVHLLTTSSANRATEATELVGYIQANVTDGSYVALAGDLNTDTRSETAITDFSAVFSTAAPYPADQAGTDGTNASRKKPYDWILASPALDALRAPTTLGTVSFPNGAVFDTRVFNPLSSLNTPGDPDAVLATDSAATNMQHMAVVREFTVTCP